MPDTSSDIMIEHYPLPSFNIDNMPTAILCLEDGTHFWGYGFGAEVTNIAEICFNTSMTGYQEIMTDPSYAGQIITFTFPHIGNVGVNQDDNEAAQPVALGMVVRNAITPPSNWRQEQPLNSWLEHHNLPAIYGVDTRALTHRIRDGGAQKAALCHRRDGQFDIDKLKTMIADWPGLAGMELASTVSTGTPFKWNKASFDLSTGKAETKSGDYHVVAVDFGCKQNILRCLVDIGCTVHIVPARISADEILAMRPDGIFLANGPGDPAETAKFAASEIAKLVASNLPIFGICIGHQLLAHAFGGNTVKMRNGHRGANHPVRDLITGKVEITSQNHGFIVDRNSLPDDIEVTHISLFDQSIEGFRHKTKPIFCVQYHPESSPGPHDSRYLFERFRMLMATPKSTSTT